MTDTETIHYRRQCTGERLGWVIHISPNTFVRVHRILSHPEDGPVILIQNEAIEVDCDGDVYSSEEAAKEAYFAAAH